MGRLLQTIKSNQTTLTTAGSQRRKGPLCLFCPTAARLYPQHLKKAFLQTSPRPLVRRLPTVRGPLGAKPLKLRLTNFVTVCGFKLTKATVTYLAQESHTATYVSLACLNTAFLRLCQNNMFLMVQRMSTEKRDTYVIETYCGQKGNKRAQRTRDVPAICCPPDRSLGSIDITTG